MEFIKRPTDGKLYSPLRHRIELRNLSKIMEIKQNNIYLNYFKLSVNEWFKPKLEEDEEYFISNIFHNTYTINESNDEETFIPRFNLKKFTNPIFAKFPPNKELKFDRDLMVLAMQYGMVVQIQYRGADDNFIMGRTRVIYPMCLGTSSKGKPLLRGYHIKGWSFSQNKNTDKVWRLFRTDRIMSMSFTGTFFRLTPEGYNTLDRGMRGGITKSVNIDEVRNNQKKLAQEGIIQSKKEVIIDNKGIKKSVVQTINANSVLDLTNPLENRNIEQDKDNLKVMRITFLKSTTSSKGIAILGALGQKGNIVKISSSGKFLGEYRVMKATMGDALGKPHLKDIEGIKEFDLHVFVKKID
jgi:hypothetical protein